MLPLTTILEQQGFSSIEARVYLSTLELWQAPVSQIARKLNENRVTIYSVIQWLVKKRLLFEIPKNKVMHYAAQSPKKLLAQAQEKVADLEDAMSTFLAMSSEADKKPNMQIYEGLDWIKMCYEDTLNYPNSTLKAFLGYGEIEPSLKRWLNNRYLSKRIKNQIVAKVIVPENLKSQYYYPPEADKKTYSKYTELGFVSDPNFELYNEIDLYGEDKVCIVMFREHEMMGIIIKSKLLYSTLSALFDLTWKRERDEE